MDPHQHPKLVIITGPSGAGKTDLRTRLLKDTSLNLKNVVTCTSREPRKGEIHGKDYFFYSRPDFEKMVQNGEMAEFAEVYGNLYGSKMHHIDKLLEEKGNPFFTVDVQGASTIQEKYSPVVTIFVKTPEIKDLENMLKKRGEKDETIKRRLAEVEKELAQAGKFKYLVINRFDHFEDTYKEVHDIIYREIHTNKEVSKRRILTL